ncbi:Amino acid permease 1 [Acorus calamus]|uniref:Amino acid permease 1 n=1 Tax=Acorus calamus TaxID=4465 RepID=A0AAV9CD84_ACOCL|nr:Amino acid permease 1 [Acorus calamus]
MDREMTDRSCRDKELRELGLERNAGDHREDEFDDDGKPRRTGTVWTASAHIITAVIGSGVLSLAWAMAQLGWIAGPVALMLFSIITFYMSSLLADCYRTSDPVFGKRNYTYIDAVRSNLGGHKIWLCGVTQYLNIFGIIIGYTITASISLAAIQKSNCFHKNGHGASCKTSNNPFMISFGVAQLFLSQIPNIHKLSWISAVAAIMSFSYSFIGIGLAIAKVASGPTGKTSIIGVVGAIGVSESQKVWRAFQALGDIAFAYSYSQILIEIQDTLGSPPQENKAMKRASLIGVSTTTTFYILCGCLGYAAFGNQAPGNMLTGFGFYEPYWLVDLANVCIAIHLTGAYQVFAQPIFAAFELRATKRWPVLVTRPIAFKLVWRSVFVMVSTVLAMTFPFFNAVLALLGALSFWPLTVYFPIEMYIAQRGVPRFGLKWVALQGLSFVCLLVSIAAACGSIEGVIDALRVYRPFMTEQ